MNRANGITESEEYLIEASRSDKSMSEIEIKKNNIKDELDKDLLTKAGKEIINQHIDSYIKNKTIEISTPHINQHIDSYIKNRTIEITTPENEKFPIRATVSSLISVSEQGKRNKPIELSS